MIQGTREGYREQGKNTGNKGRIQRHCKNTMDKRMIQGTREGYRGQGKDTGNKGTI